MIGTFFSKVYSELMVLLDTLFTPKYNFRMRMRFLNILVLDRIFRRTRVTGLEIINTYRCNARCSFCAFGGISDDRTDMGGVLFSRILEQAKKEGVVLMVFLGGESLLDKNLYSYLDQCWESGISTALQTNGINLTEECLLRLKASHINNISITMHDAEAAHHDGVYKVKGSFETVSRAIGFAKKHGVKITLKAVFSANSDKDGSFLRILEMAKKHGLELNVNPFMPVGDGLEGDGRLSKSQVRYFRELAFSDPTISSHLFYKQRLTPCFAGAYYFCISPKGDILPCGFMPISLGNIKTTSLSEAHEAAMKIPLFAKRLKTCFVAESESFYREILVPIHKNYPELPVNILEHREVYDLIARFDTDKLEREIYEP